MIHIEDNVPLPSGQGRLRERAIIVPQVIKRAMERYSEAYRSVYGVLPDMTYDGAFIRIHGQAQGFKPHRLREMIQQLKWRAG